MKKCPFCTAPVPPLACKCSHCGEWVEAAFPDPAADARTRGEVRTQRFFGFYLVLTVLGMLIGLAMFFGTAVPFWGHLQKEQEHIRQELNKKPAPPAPGSAPPPPPPPPQAPAR
jgi:hypothetical protein